MNPRDGARLIAIGRVAFGVSMLAAPKLMRGWLGDVVDAPGGQVAVRALGVRDLILGALTLHTLNHPEVAPRYVMTCAAADTVDAAATLASGLPASKRYATAVFAGGSAAAGFAFARGLK